MPHFVYNEFSMLSWDDHVFPVAKYNLVKQMLLDCGISEDDFTTSPEATIEEIKLVHTHDFLSRIEDYIYRNPYEAVHEFEALCDMDVYDSFKKMCGGSILAGKLALENKSFGFHIGGGFHHSFNNHGEGFCILNDIAVSIKVLQKKKLINKAAVIDVDVHQGNGTAYIFENDPDVFTFSIHNDFIYPFAKMKSNIDIGLPAGTGDDEYLPNLEKHIPEIFDNHKPDLVYYVAGADPYIDDKLGGMQLTIEGLNKRDEIVISVAQNLGIPVVVLLAGGYAIKTEDVARIHFNAAKTCLEKFNIPSRT